MTIERPHRVAVRVAAADGGPPPRLEAAFYDDDGLLVSRISATAGQALLRDEWDLAEPGEYLLQLFGAEPETRALHVTVISRPMVASGGGSIAYGESRAGEIAVRGQRDQWRFDGQAGDMLVISMIAAQADPYLELYGPGGDLITVNDDATAGERNARLALPLSVSGTYTLVARMADDDQTGAYRLSLDRQP